MKRYRLKKDLPTFKTGMIAELDEKGDLVLYGTRESGAPFIRGYVIYTRPELDVSPNILTDWFEEIPEEPQFGVIATSKLAGLEIADKDYVEGDKRHFTFDGALEVEKKLEGTGWRLPTRHEWVLICEEFANGEDDNLKPELLEEKLGLGRHGWYDSEHKRLYAPGRQALYWSRSSYSSSSSARYLNFNNTSVYPSNYGSRYDGMSLRLVRDLESA